MIIPFFGLSFIGGHYSEFIYQSIKNQAAAHIVFNYKKTFGIKYDYTKVVWYFNKLTRFTDDMIDQSTWLMNYGADLKKDIEKHKDILTSVLGLVIFMVCLITGNIERIGSTLTM